MKRILAIALVLIISSVSLGQPAHTPSYTVTGYTVTFDADFVGFDANGPMPESLIDGVVINWPHTYSARSETDNVVVLVKPGVSYNVTMLGRPDDPSTPNRNLVSDVVQVQLTEQDEIQMAMDAFRESLRVLEVNNVDVVKLADAFNR